MRKSNPTTRRRENIGAMAIVAFGLTCFLAVEQTNAQFPTSNTPTGNWLAPRVGEIKSERIYKPSRPTADKLTTSKLTIVKPKLEPKLGLQTAKLKPKTAAQPKPKLPDAKKLSSTIKKTQLDNKTTIALPAKAALAPVKNQPAKSKQNIEHSDQPSNLTPPTVVVRPSVAQPNHLNECVFEINEIKSTNDVSLKVAIPDSVTMIEVVPNRSTNSARSFRIKMEQGVEPEQKSPVAASLNQQTQQPRCPVELQPLPQHVSSTPSVPFDEVPQSFRPGFSKNPFFVQKVAKAQQPIPAQHPVPFQQPTHRLRQTEAHQDNVAREATPTFKQAYRNDTVGVRDFFQRTSHSLPVETPPQGNLQELTFEPASQQPQFAYSFLPSKPIIAAQIVGPASVDVGQTADYMVAIVNPMNSINRNLAIELDVPRGLEVVLLDRAADFNGRTRTLYWTVNEIQPGEEVKLNYRVKSIRKGKQLQRVAVRIGDDLLETHEVLTIAQLNIDAGASELPFD